ncbi:Filament-forming protein, partial [Linderina pennispora]
MSISPTARVAIQMLNASQDGRINITQLYTEKVALEDKLKKSEAEVACLRESMEQILSEIEERGPIIAAEREEYHRLLEEADKLSCDLTESRQENDRNVAMLKKTRKERDLLRQQLSTEEQQTRDLSRQVANLLRKAEEARSGGRTVPEARDNGGRPSASQVTPDEEEQWLDDVDKVISQGLVTFNNITEIVEQNRRLLRTTRELASHVAQEEERQREANE